MSTNINNKKALIAFQLTDDLEYEDNDDDVTIIDDNIGIQRQIEYSNVSEKELCNVSICNQPLNDSSELHVKPRSQDASRIPSLNKVKERNDMRTAAFRGCNLRTKIRDQSNNDSIGSEVCCYNENEKTNNKTTTQLLKSSSRNRCDSDANNYSSRYRLSATLTAGRIKRRRNAHQLQKVTVDVVDLCEEPALSNSDISVCRSDNNECSATRRKLPKASCSRKSKRSTPKTLYNLLKRKDTDSDKFAFENYETVCIFCKMQSEPAELEQLTPQCNARYHLHCLIEMRDFAIQNGWTSPPVICGPCARGLRDTMSVDDIADLEGNAEDEEDKYLSECEEEYGWNDHEKLLTTK